MYCFNTIAIVSLRVKCRRTLAHGSLESMQTQRGHLFADLVHVLKVSAKILLSCVASVSARVRPESFALSNFSRNKSIESACNAV